MQSLAITLCSRRLPVQRGQRALLVPVLEAAGHRVSDVGDGPLDLAAADVVWVIGNANWFPRLRRQLIATPKHNRPVVCIWHSEPLPPSRAARLPWPRLHLRELAKILLRDARATDAYTNYWRIRQLARHGLPDVLAVSAPGWVEFLLERGICADWVPLGYDPSFGRDLGLQRDIDVLFLGALDVPRRRRILRGLRAAGIDLTATGSWVDPSCWGEERTRLLNRTKILLNLARKPGDLSAHRLLLGMANKALVISEPIYRPAPFVAGTHFISTPVEEMPDVIRSYLARDAERQRIVEAAYRLVTEEITLSRSASQVLALIRSRLEAAGPACANSARNAPRPTPRG